MSSELLDALTALEKQKGISRDVLIEAIEAALVTAYKRNFNQAQNVRVDINLANGVGLAAVQIGVLKRICVVSVEAPEPIVDKDGNEIEVNPLIHNNGEDLIIINPEVIPQEGRTQTDYEGCLSLPGKYGQVTRPFHVTLKAFDRNLEPFELEAEGLFARAICHECDHMEGILYKDLVEGELVDVADLMPEGDEEDEQSDKGAVAKIFATSSQKVKIVLKGRNGEEFINSEMLI